MTPSIASDRVSVVLVHTRNPLNIGAAARAMANFGFHNLRVVQPWQPSWQEARSAVGAASVLASAHEFSTLAEAVADCTLVLGTAGMARRHPVQPVISLPDLGRELPAHLRAGRLALVFGSEKSGLSNDDFTHCSAILHIPTQPEQESVNLGQAVAVCLYELAHHTHAAPPSIANPSTPQPATAADRERLTQAIQRVLQLSNYIKPGADLSTLQQLREMLQRLNPSADDSHRLLGMFHRIEHRLSRRNPQHDS
jgi:tRNA/rRNA methyltransferase